MSSGLRTEGCRCHQESDTESQDHCPKFTTKNTCEDCGMSQPEPWLRGIDPVVDPVIGHLLHGSQHLREDMAHALGDLTVAQLWTPVHGLTCAGFQAKHLAGSTLRLCTYLEGEQLTAEQIGAIASESSGNENAAQLGEIVNQALDRYDALVRTLRSADFGAIREIGRKRLQTTVVSLAIHIVEHGMRHVGLAIAAAKAATNV
jgi:hypothetical protein